MDILPLVLVSFFLIALTQLAIVWYLWRRDPTSPRQEAGIRGAGGDGRGSGSDSGLDKQSWDVLHSAIKKSEAMVGEAELESLKMTAEGRLHLEKLEKKLAEQVDLTASEIQKSFLDGVAQASSEYKNYLNSMEEKAKSDREAMRVLVGERAKAMFSQVEKDFKEETGEFLRKAMAANEAEIKATKEALSAYRKQRESVLDKQFQQILDSALKSFIAKGLTNEDHIKLINESLDEAKADHFLEV